MSTPPLDVSQVRTPPATDMRHEPCEPGTSCESCHIIAQHLFTSHTILSHHFPLVDGMNAHQLELVVRFARGGFTAEQWAILQR